MTVRDETLIEVQNLTGHTVGYNSFDGKHRVFEGYQTIKISAEELRQLNYTRGGNVLLRNHLSVKNQELARELGVSDDSFEHEYNWTYNDMVNLLTNGSIDELKDALDFAPSGVVDNLVDLAVELKVSDIVKRKAIFDATGRDVNTMIELVEQSQAGMTDEEIMANVPQRRRVVPATIEAPKRRVAAQ